METERQFSLYFPICKAVPQDDGSIMLGGVCSDYSKDLEGERVVNTEQSMRKTLDFLPQWGKVNWIHGGEDIGDVLEARLITAAEVAREFGRKIEGDAGTFIKARIYPVLDPVLAPTPKAVGDAQYYIRSGGKLGWSLQGSCIRDGSIVKASFAHKVALCPQPMNTNSFATVLAKSLQDGLLQAGGVGEGTGAEQASITLILPELETTTPVTAGDPLVMVPQSFLTNLVKDATGGMMTAGTGVDASKFTGGRALGRESLGKHSKHVAWCPGCQKKYRGKEGQKCGRCGEKWQDIQETVYKAFGTLHGIGLPTVAEILGAVSPGGEAMTWR